ILFVILFLIILFFFLFLFLDDLPGGFDEYLNLLLVGRGQLDFVVFVLVLLGDFLDDVVLRLGVLLRQRLGDLLGQLLLVELFVDSDEGAVGLALDLVLVVLVRKRYLIDGGFAVVAGLFGGPGQLGAGELGLDCVQHGLGQLIHVDLLFVGPS